MLPLKWILFVLVSVQCAQGRRSVIDILRANTSAEWNEDLEPVLENLLKRVRKELFPIVQEILYDEEISNECLQSLARLNSGLADRRLWAFKFLDSSGGMAPGKVGVHMGSLGNYDQCLGIRVPERDDPEKIAFGGKYCTASLKISRQPLLYNLLPGIVAQDPVIEEFFGGANATWALELVEKLPIGYRLGLCLPSTCESSIIPHLTKKFAGKYGLEADVLACRDQLSEEPVATGTLVAGIVTATLTAFVILGTIVDGLYGEDSRGAVRVVQCFSVRASYLKVATTDIPPDRQHLDSIHGIRVLSSFWILFSHTYGGDPALYDNMRSFLDALRNPFFSFVLQGTLAVETFFTVTGILMYRTLRGEFKSNRLPVPVFTVMVLIRRAFRLVAPALGAICLFYLFPLLTSGPGFDTFYPFFKENCDRNWWTIPLFINNFWSFEEACVGNQWYNAADMQLLCILILPVLLLVRRPAKGFLVISILIGASVLYTAAITLYYDATPAIVMVPRRMTGILKFVLRIHDRSLPHLAAMGVGVLGGYLIEHHRDTKIAKALARAGWIIFSALMFVLVFVIFVWNKRGSISTPESLIYAGFHRPLWAMCIVWLVFMCSSGRAKSVRWFLSRPNFIILSRLSLCFYLTQMPMVMIKNFTARSMVPFTFYQNFRDFFADMAFNYAAAWVLFLLFEAPAYALDKLMASKRSKQDTSSFGDEKMKYDSDERAEHLPSVQYKL